jgi:hypothetical protein
MVDLDVEVSRDSQHQRHNFSRDLLTVLEMLYHDFDILMKRVECFG